jgi:hypothetical protein
MRRTLIALLAALSLTMAVAASAQDQPASFDGSRAHVYKSAPGRSLSATSKAAPTSVVGQFLGSKGVDATTLASLRTVDQHSNPATA